MDESKHTNKILFLLSQLTGSPLVLEFGFASYTYSQMLQVVIE